MPDFFNVVKVRHWLLKLAESQDKVINTINYIFCSDEHLLSINKEFLGHDYYTDIITFPYKEYAELESDIFISLERVQENAAKYDSSYEKELIRVLAHGLLHLCGLKDKSQEDIAHMREAEEQAIQLYYN